MKIIQFSCLLKCLLINRSMRRASKAKSASNNNFLGPLQCRNPELRFSVNNHLDKLLLSNAMVAFNRIPTEKGSIVQAFHLSVRQQKTAAALREFNCSSSLADCKVAIIVFESGFLSISGPIHRDDKDHLANKIPS